MDNIISTNEYFAAIFSINNLASLVAALDSRSARPSWRGWAAKMRQLFTLFTVFFFASNLFANEYEGETFLTIAAFNERNGEHSGVEISGLANMRGNLAGRFSGVLYSEDEESEYAEIYGGFSGTAYFHLGLKDINPYLGLGLFIGDTFNCSDDEEKNGTCEEDTVLAAYPEAGLGINIQRLHVFVFGRRYFDTNDHAGTVSAYGAHVGFKFSK